MYVNKQKGRNVVPEVGKSHDLRTRSPAIFSTIIHGNFPERDIVLRTGLINPPELIHGFQRPANRTIYSLIEAINN
jgi:hypothetical protein